MGQNIEDKILKVFYNYPNKKFTIRELVKLTRIPRATLHKYIKDLKSGNLIDNENKAKNTLLFKTKKINYFIEKIVSCGVIDELIKNLNPACIILFGSIRKGDSIKESDIDLFVESQIRKHVNLNKFEKKLKRRIQLFVYDDITKLQPNLFNNVINGIKLYGSFKIR